MTETKPKRRRFKFSLRTLFVLVTVLGVWLGFKVNSARRQKEAVEAISNAGGSLQYDFQFASNSTPGQGHWIVDYDANALPWGLPLMRKLFGDDFCRKAGGVIWHTSNIPESAFMQLDNLTDVAVVNLKAVKIVPNGSNIPRQIQDADFSVFAQQSRLELLEIWNSNITGSCFGQLTALRHLKVLKIRNATVDDAGMQFAKALTQLETLDLSNNQITDEGVKYLRQLVNLKSLWLQQNAGITNAGLKYLSGLTNLKAIYLERSGVTHDGIQELQNVLPNTKISGP